jgi:cation diffusion facilitator family transporter
VIQGFKLTLFIDTCQATGVGLTMHALEGIVGEHLGWELGHGHSHGHGGHGAGPTQIALYAAVASLVVNEVLFRATLFVAKKERSQVLEANAWHHRSDAMSSGAAFIGIVGSMAGYPQFDPIASVVVSGMIIRAGFYIFTDVIRELTDRKMDHAVHDQLVALLEQFKQQSNNGVAIAHDDQAHDEHDHSKCDEHNLADAHLTNHVIGYHTIRYVTRYVRARVS